MESKNGVGYRIIPDETPESPRDCDNIGTMVCWHNRYTLGDEQPELSPIEWRMSLWSELGTDKENHSRFVHYVQKHCFSDLQESLEEGGALEDILEYNEAEHPVFDLPSKILALPLYLYDHSGLVLSSGPFSCPWDSGQVGYIWVERDKGIEECGSVDKVFKMLEAEVETYSQYLSGDVYGYEIHKHGEVVDSCWGFYGYDVAEEEAKAQLKYINQRSCNG